MELIKDDFINEKLIHQYSIEMISDLIQFVSKLDYEFHKYKRNSKEKSDDVIENALYAFEIAADKAAFENVKLSYIEVLKSALNAYGESND